MKKGYLANPPPVRIKLQEITRTFFVKFKSLFKLYFVCISQTENENPKKKYISVLYNFLNV